MHVTCHDWNPGVRPAALRRISIDPGALRPIRFESVHEISRALQNSRTQDSSPSESSLPDGFARLQCRSPFEEFDLVACGERSQPDGPSMACNGFSVQRTLWRVVGVS